MNPHDIIIKPIISEQTSKLSELNNSYTFKVAKGANKIAIKDAVEKLFDVKVKKVNTLNFKGKKRRVRAKLGMTASWKKAYVTLQSGDRIEIFEGV